MSAPAPAASNASSTLWHSTLRKMTRKIIVFFFCFWMLQRCRKSAEEMFLFAVILFSHLNFRRKSRRTSGLLYCICDWACAPDVIVFQHNHLGQILSVSGSSADEECIFLDMFETWSSFSCSCVMLWHHIQTAQTTARKVPATHPCQLWVWAMSAEALAREATPEARASMFRAVLSARSIFRHFPVTTATTTLFFGASSTSIKSPSLKFHTTFNSKYSNTASANGLPANTPELLHSRWEVSTFSPTTKPPES